MMTVVLAGASILGGVASAQSMDCDDRPLTTHDYHQQAGDQSQQSAFRVVRAFDGTGKLGVGICNANVRILSRPGANSLELTVDAPGLNQSQRAADFIHTLRVEARDGSIKLKFPKSARARVTLTVPLKRDSDFELNLGKGDLELNSAGMAGDRRINVGMGAMKLVVDDASYASMQVNIGMGSLHDHRPGGEDGHFVVSKEYEAKGSGSLEINVGMGSLDIRKE
jgi:hypothetical protein